VARAFGWTWAVDEDLLDDNVPKPGTLQDEIVVEERALAALIEATGGDAADAVAALARTDADVARLQQLFVPAQGFRFHRDAADDDFDVECRSLFRRDIGGLSPLWADAAPFDARAALVAQLEDPARFGHAFGIPGIAADDVSRLR
jgi:hypothetical protein